MQNTWKSAYLYFNSRPSARGDFNFYREAFDNLIISIHAPPRGATLCRDFRNTLIYFNSRPSARGDNPQE